MSASTAAVPASVFAELSAWYVVPVLLGDAATSRSWTEPVPLAVGLAVALEEIWLDAGLVPEVRAEDLSESLYFSLRTMFGLEIARVEDRVGVAPVPGWTHGGFAPAAGALVGHVERLGALPNGTAVEHSRTWFDPARARYVSRMIQEAA